MDVFKENKLFLILDILNKLLLISIICLILYFSNTNKVVEEPIIEDQITEVEEIKQEIIEEGPVNYKVDIKGAIKAPGVYELNKNSIINDVINIAGGLKSNASTKYINLSKKISNEMVIYIYTNYEISQMQSHPKEECTTNNSDIKDCKNSSTIISNDNKNDNSSSNSNQSNKVSINKGTKEELMTLSGIGESKANAIIEYRNTNGEFKVLEDLINVSGIGKEAFEKIKDNIEL